MILTKLGMKSSLPPAYLISYCKHAQHIQNKSLQVSSSLVLNNHSFHSLSRNKYAISQVHSSTASRGISSTAKEEPIFESIIRFLAESPQAMELQTLAIKFHDASGLHWWSSIALLTFAFRLVFTFGPAVYQQYIVAKVANISQEMNEIASELQVVAKRALLEKHIDPKRVNFMYKKSIKAHWDQLVIRDNCHPMKSIVIVLFQVPLFLLFSSALRNIAYGYPQDDASVLIASTEMSLGGLAWCPNLLVPDPTFIIPILLGVSNLAILEVQVLSKPTQDEPLSRKIGIWLFRGVVIAMVPLAAQMPSAISLYWLCSSMYGFGQNLVLLSPKVRKFCRIPDSPVGLAHPYRTIWEGLSSKLQLKKAEPVGVFKK